MQAGAFGAQRKVKVLCAEEKSSAYLEHDPEKNVFGSYCHVREPKTRRLPMTFPDFAACLSTWTLKKLLLKVGFLSLNTLFPIRILSEAGKEPSFQGML